jgi:hypothetical protein
MKTHISKGTGINMVSTNIKLNPDTKEVIRGQLRENKILQMDNQKFSKYAADANDFYADVFFIFNFPQRKIHKALKESK